jgi:hypothetical protein
MLIALSCLAVISILTCGRNTPPPGEDREGQSANANTSEESDRTDGGTSAADNLDVCSQLTREEVEAALGRSVSAPVPGAALTSRRAGTITSSCMFSSSEGFVSLDIKRQDPASTTVWNAAKAYEELKERIIKAHGSESSVRFEEVSGVGINAFVETTEVTASSQTTELRVLSKRSILTVRVVGPPATSTLEAAKTLALKAIGRLEKFEEAAINPVPVKTTPAPDPTPNPSEDERSRASEKSPAEQKNNRDINPTPARRGRNETSAAVTKSRERRRAETNSRERRTGGRESAQRTRDRTKRVLTKRSNSRRRP